VLVDALHCNDWQAQQSAARALGDIGDISATDPLIELAIQHTYPDVRRVAIEALGTTGNPSSGCLLEFLGQKAKETGDEEGRTAAWALNRINERRKNGER
jgi:HEAT repeat protein